MAKAINLANLPAERRAEIDEQRKQHESEADRWEELFDGLESRVLGPAFERMSEELSKSGEWADETPTFKTRPSGSGRKAEGRFRVRGLTEETPRPVDIAIEIYPGSNDRFVVAVRAGGKIQREMFAAEPFRSDDDRPEADAKLRSWLDGQYERHVRRSVQF